MTIIDTTPLLMTDPEIVPGRRSVKYRWVLSQEDVLEYDDPNRPGVHYIYVTLDVDHYGRSEIAGRLEYCYLARLMYEDITRFETHTMQRIQYLGGGALRLLQEPAKRFSQKRLDQFAEEALVDLRNRRDDDVIQSMFAGEGTGG